MFTDPTLYAQWRAGTLPKARVPLGSSASAAVKGWERGEAQSEEDAPPPQASPASAGEGEVRPASELPRAVAWLYKLAPMSAGTLASMLGPLVSEHAEMKAFLAEVPQAGRLLRPICSMVGVKPPDWLALPKRACAVAHPPPRPSPSRGYGIHTFCEAGLAR